MDFSEYTKKSSEEVLETLKTSLSGLSKKEVILRQKKYGFNEIRSKSINAFVVLVRQLKAPFIYLLFVAALISFFIGEKIDFYVMLVIVVVNQ